MSIPRLIASRLRIPAVLLAATAIAAAAIPLGDRLEVRATVSEHGHVNVRWQLVSSDDDLLVAGLQTRGKGRRLSKAKGNKFTTTVDQSETTADAVFTADPLPTTAEKDAANQTTTTKTEVVAAEAEPDKTEVATFEPAPTKAEALAAETEPAKTEAVKLEPAPTKAEALATETEPAKTEVATLEPAPTKAETVATETEQPKTEVATLEPAPTKAETVAAESEPAKTEVAALEPPPTKTEIVAAETETTRTKVATLEPAPTKAETVAAESEPEKTEVATLEPAPTKIETVAAEAEPEKTEVATLEPAPTKAETLAAEAEPTKADLTPLESAPARTEAVAGETAPTKTVAGTAQPSPSKTEAVTVESTPTKSDVSSQDLSSPSTSTKVTSPSTVIAVEATPQVPLPTESSPASKLRLRIYRSLAGGKPVPLSGVTPGRPIITKTPLGRKTVVGAFTDPTAERGRTYSYRLELVDTESRSVAAASETFEVTVHDGKPPAAVARLRAVPTPKQIVLGWTPVEDPEVTAYRVYRSREAPGASGDLSVKTRAAASGTGAQTTVPGSNLSLASSVSTGSGGPQWLDTGTQTQFRTAFDSRIEGLRASAHGTLLAELPPDQLLYEDRQAEPHARYHYRVVAVDPYNGEGEASMPAVSALVDIVPPKPPAAVVATPSSAGKVLVQWRPSASSDVETYKVFREASEGAPVMVRALGAKTEKTTDDLDPRSQFRYRYSVVAYDAAGNASSPTISESIRLPDIVAPAAPGVTDISVAGGVVAVAWTAPADQDTLRFNVYRQRLDHQEAARRINPTPIRATAFRDSSGLLGARYDYWVTAVDPGGNEGPESRRYEQRVIGSIEPRAPQGVSVRQGPQGFPLISWQALGGSVDIRYVVFRASSPTGTFEPVSGVLSDTAFLDRGAPDGAAWYRIVARYYTGQLSPASSTVPWNVTAR